MQPAEGETGPQPLSFVQDKGTVRDLTQGRIEHTDAPFDLAINGKGYFVGADARRRPLHPQRPFRARCATASSSPTTAIRCRAKAATITITPDDGDIHIGAGRNDHRRARPARQAAARRFRQRSGAEEGRRQPLFDRRRPPNAGRQARRSSRACSKTSNVEPVIEISHMIEVHARLSGDRQPHPVPGRSHAPGHRQARRRCRT